MKKCTRCSNMIDWDKPFCPLCGGSVTDVPSPPKVGPSAPAVVEKISSAQREPASVPPLPANIPPVPAPTRAAVPPVPQVPPIAPAGLPTVPPVARTEVPPAPRVAVPPFVPVPPVSVSAPPVQAGTPQIPFPASAPSDEARVPAPPLTPPVPPAGLFSQIHQTPGIPAPQAPPLAAVISQIHQNAAGTPPPPPSPQAGGFFSQIHQSQSSPALPSAQGTEMPEEPPVVLPKPEVPSAANANTGPPVGQKTDRPRTRVTFQDLTDRIDGSEASLDNALEALLKSGPPLDFSPPPPATPPPFFIPPPEEEQAPLPFTLEHAGGDDGEKDVLSPNLAEIMGINYLANLVDNKPEAAPKAAPQTPLKPQVPPAGGVMPNLPDDKPKESASGDDSDFLKMFPGVGG